MQKFLLFLVFVCLYCFVSLCPVCVYAVKNDSILINNSKFSLNHKALSVISASKRPIQASGPPLLKYSELLELSKCGEVIPSNLKIKMDKLLTTPFIENISVARKPHIPVSPRIGKCLRVAEWNIERGLNFEMIVAALSNSKEFTKFIDVEKYKPSDDIYKEALKQVQILKDADILILNEVDWGVKRTKYRNVCRELATTLGMNYAYAVEFLEIDPVTIGTEKFEGMSNQDRIVLKKEIAVNTHRYLGLHGTAVLSRYPIKQAMVLPLTPAYDWFNGERESVSLPEKGKRTAADKVFLEKILREIRRGGRTVLRVDLEMPDIKEKIISIIAPHLENKCKPDERLKQLREVLTYVKNIKNPVVIAGDMNTTLRDGTPTTIKREIMKRIGSKSFWIKKGFKYATGIGLLFDVATNGTNFLKNQQDPTARHIPIIAPNPETNFFKELEDMRFEDGFVFDFRGDKLHSTDDKSGTLANSNQRASKGFVPTFELERTIGPVGKFKLDWFFIKAYLRNPRDEADSYQLAPHYGRTLSEINNIVVDQISDHCPITVDLPFENIQ